MVKKLLLKGVREGIGRLIVLGDHLSRPKPKQRTEEQQLQVDQSCKNLTLYQFYACPFCIKVRRHIHRLGLNVEKINAQNVQMKAFLAEQGGKVRVPCLCINENNKIQYLYESDNIIAYLNQRFGQS